MPQITDWRGTFIYPGDFVLFATANSRNCSMVHAVVEAVDPEDGSVRVHVLSRSHLWWSTEEIIRLRPGDYSYESITVISGFPETPDGL